MTRTNKALVIGGLGVAGGYIVRHLAELADWDVAAAARSAPGEHASAKASYIALDITDPAACRQKLSPFADVTHLFYAARRDDGDAAEQARVNLTMLRNVLEVVEDVSPGLRHVNLMHGMKAYGNLLGPFKTPALETDPRLPPPLTYYVQEDYVRNRQRGRRWTWSALRPGPIFGVTVGYSGNLVSILGVYGSLCRELGVPFWFPGSAQAFAALRHGCDARLLAKAAAWTSTCSACANQAFNVGNGELFRWEHVWPAIAAFFGLEPAGPVNLRLTEYMRDKAPVWERVVAKHDLVAHPFERLVSWGYSDTFHKGWDSFASETRLRMTGFSEVADTCSSLLDLLGQLRGMRVIP